MSKKYDDDRENPFSNLEKSIVLQEARVFNEYPVHPRKCRTVLTKLILILQYQPCPLTRPEATNLFFSITKLFQNPNVALRQMIYLAIKELASQADDVMMVTQSLTKDVNSKEDVIYRPNAIRALCKITSSGDVQIIERFMKQSIVDKNHCVASAALVSCFYLHVLNKDIVKRWSNEIQEAIMSKGSSAQYHAIGLLYQLRSNDRMAIMKMIHTYAKGTLRSPFAICMLVRFTLKMLQDDSSDSMVLFDYLEQWLRHKNDMVVYEAARCICNVKQVSKKQLMPVISALQLLLVHHKTTLRFCAIRTLHSLAMTHPEAVSVCNLDLENLITDGNRSISTLAMTTLLKTGNESSVDRLMKQISGFMSDISDDFKIIVVDAIRCLCLKFPSKHHSMLLFLKDCLRDEGGYEFKKSIVEAIFDIIHSIPESKEIALEHLCEFIEDCDFTTLAVRILHVLGTQGPSTNQPTKYIRYIYNRVVLENAIVRAAAVSALARFAEHLDESRERIKILLQRCSGDSDDEVRDRAVFYLRLIHNQELSRKYIANESSFSWNVFENMLQNYLENPQGFDTPFDMSIVPIVSKTQEQMESIRQKEVAIELATGVSAIVPQTTHSITKDTGPIQFANIMSEIPQLNQLGPLFKSSPVVFLTEQEEEYVISCIKHCFPHHLVFQFECKNTLEDSILEQVTVAMSVVSSPDQSIHDLVPKFCIPVDKLVYNQPASIYAVYERTNDVTPAGKFNVSLKFHVRDCDPETGLVDDNSYPDEYTPETIDVSIGDYINKGTCTDFNQTWHQLESQKVTETFSLSHITSVQETIDFLQLVLGLHPLGTSHGQSDLRASVCFCGTFVGGELVLARVEMIVNPTEGVTLQLNVCSRDMELSRMIVDGIQ